MSMPLRLLKSATLSILLLVGTLASCAALATENISGFKYATVPVYYLTDRTMKGATYGNRRRYQNNCLHKMYYGTAYVTVRNLNDEQANDTLTALDWKLTNQKGKSICPKDKVEAAHEPRELFFQRITEALDRDQTDTLCVYVPGAEEGFEEACTDAAQLAYAMKRPLILYSWPSEPRLKGYLVDNNNSEWSQGHFKRFIQHLASFKEKHPLKVVFVAHSMGNRFLLRSIHEIYRANLAKDMEIVSADMDLDTCRHYLLGFGRVDNRSAIRFYVSNRDHMLAISRRIFGGYSRLGEDVEHQLGPSRSVREEIIQKEADIGKKIKSIGKKMLTIAGRIDQSHDETSDDEATDNKAEHTTDDVFEIIDFTALDKGVTGHSMPFQLIGDMVNGTQIPGFKLVDDNSGKTEVQILERRQASQ